MSTPKANVGDDAEKRADAVIASWVGNRVSMRLQRDAIAEAIRQAANVVAAKVDVGAIIEDIDAIARGHDQYEYGLPVHSKDCYEEMCRAVTDEVRRALHAAGSPGA